MQYNPFSLIGKTVLVTGASSGIGKAIAIECAKLGASVIVTARNELRLKETFDILEGENHQMHLADIGNSNDIERLITKLPILDGVVHSAGLIKMVPFQFATRESLDEVMNINFFAAVEVSRRLLKVKKLKSFASIIFISSISGVSCSWVASSIYSASKGAINGLIKGMALDLASKRIRVNSVNPGEVESALLSDGIITEVQLEVEISKYPLKRYGKPEEVAYAVVYLLSDASAWVTGTNLIIDGGYTLQ